MQTFFHGTDKGNAAITALVLILVLSTVFLSLLPRITAVKRYAKEYRAKVILSIEQSNREIMNQYDSD